MIAFLCLFYYGYKQYLKEDNSKNVLLIAVSIAGVMMSKYHGFLMVLFTVLSNLSLLKKKSFWAIVVITTLLMIPHLLWQIDNYFATFKFHLYNRIDMDFSWDDIAYYIFVQPIVFGPLIGVILLYALVKSKPTDLFKKALIFSVWGIFLFFLYTTFKVEFHKHWTSVVAIPLILLGFEFINDRPKLAKTTIRLSQVTLVLLVLAKAYLMYDYLPKSLTKDWDVLHGWDVWKDEVKELSGGLPVVFNNHYERASRHQYLSKDQTHCYNTFDYRETQHDMLPFEEELQGKTVFMINRRRDTLHFETFRTSVRKDLHHMVVENFRSYRNVWIETVDEIEAEDGGIETNITLENRYSRSVNFDNAGRRDVWLNAHVLKGLKEVKRIRIRKMEGGMTEG